MSQVITAGPDKRLIIYNISNYIILRAAFVDSMERPIVLANDCIEGLTEAVYKNALYYAYINTKGIVLKNVMSQKDIHIIPKESGVSSPKLLVLDNKLVLFYMAKNPLDDSYILKALIMDENIKEEIYEEMCSKRDCFDAFTVSGDAYLCFEKQIYKIEKIGHFSKLCSEKKLKNEMMKRSDDDNKRIEELEKRNKEQAAVIESIKQQYEELMQTAIQYRNAYFSIE